MDIIQILAALVVGFAIIMWLYRLILLRRAHEDLYSNWRRHPKESFYIDGYVFHAWIKTQPGGFPLFLFLLGAAGLYFGWKGIAAWPHFPQTLSGIAGLILITVGLFKMNIWPWSPREVSISPTSWTVYRSGTDQFYGHRANYYVGSSGLKMDGELQVTQAWQKIEHSHFTVRRSAIGSKAYDMLLLYMEALGYK